MPKWKWIERRAAAIMDYFGESARVALIAAIEDWEWAHPEGART